MTEFELIVAIRDTSDSASLHFMNFVTGLFAFVLAAYFVGGRLSRANAGILIGLFATFSFITGFAAISRLRWVGILHEQLLALPDPELPLMALNFALVPYAPRLIGIVLFVAFAGGVAFLLEVRRAPGSNEPPAD